MAELAAERAERASRRREITGYVILIFLVSTVVFFTAYGSSARQQDLLQLACGNAQGHHDLTVAVVESARLTERVARELGLHVEPVVITIPEVPEECRGVPSH